MKTVILGRDEAFNLGIRRFARGAPNLHCYWNFYDARRVKRARRRLREHVRTTMKYYSNLQRCG